MELSNLSFEELIDLKNRVDSAIYSYKDGYVYICKVRSYGKNRTMSVNNTHELQELCYDYDGEDGIVDVYSTNPDLSFISNYGDLKYIESVEDYKNWYEYEQLKRLVPEIKDELDRWDNRDNVPFRERPLFSPIYSREDLDKFEFELSVFDMSFKPPRSYERNED